MAGSSSRWSSSRAPRFGKVWAAHLAVRDGLDVPIQMASALTAAHAAGVVHRDLKPENVMLRPDGVVKVLDFGLAKFASAEPAADTEPTRTVLHTDAGTVMGTVAYMSPEQARGQEVDARTEIWSLGAVLYEAIAGRRPFTGQGNTDVLTEILEREPDALARFAPDTPAELQRIVTKILRKDREQRYQSMKDLLTDVQALRDSEANVEHGVAQMVSRKVLAGAALVVVAAAGGAWWALHSRHIANETMHTGPAQRNLTHLTFDPGLQADATWSPDGRFIAYASDKTGNFDIWVQPDDGQC